MTEKQMIINGYDITIEFKPCNKLNPYLQWEHIAMWHFRFNLELMTREAIEQMGGI